MTLFRLDHFKRRALLALIVFATVFPVTALAKTTGVTSDSTLESGPCYQALVDKNAETPSTAPNRELGDACRVENGDVDKAWARVIRLWGSDSADVPDYGSFVRADAPVPGTTPIWLALVSIVLMYGVAATPMRPATSLMRGGQGKGLLVAELVISLIGRAVIGLVLLAVFSFSIPTLVGCVLLVALLLRRLMLANSGFRSPQAGTEAEHQSATALLLTDVINDIAGGAAGLIGVSLLADHSLVVLAGALLAALVLSAPPLLAIRRFIVLQPIALTAMTTFLVVAVTVYWFNDPLINAYVSGSIYIMAAVSLLLIAVTVVVGWRTWGSELLSLKA